MLDLGRRLHDVLRHVHGAAVSSTDGEYRVRQLESRCYKLAMSEGDVCDWRVMFKKVQVAYLEV